MKICLLTRRFDLSSGGIGRVATEIRNRLVELGHEVYSVSTDKEDLANYFKYTFWGIRSQIPAGCDVYHAITPMESIWIPKERSVATILDIIPITHPEKHGARMGGNRLKYTVGQQCFSFGCKQAAKCARVACISNHVRGEFAYHFGRQPQTIRLGVSENLKPRVTSNPILRIGYLGQVDRRKRVDMLVDAFTKSSLEAELWIAGDGIDRRSLQWAAVSDHRLHFTGFLPEDALPDFYNSLDVMVFPTAIEGYGLPPVEAMACKKPVIVLLDAIIPPDVKSRCAVVDDLSSLFSDSQYLVNAMETVAIESNYRFAKEHSWKECVDQYLKMYEEVAG